MKSFQTEPVPIRESTLPLSGVHVALRRSINLFALRAPINMCIDRRNFLRASAGLAGAAMMPSFAFADTNEVELIQQRQDVPDLIKNLRPVTRDRSEEHTSEL